MGLFLQGQWEGVVPVAGTFLVFLRNFSKGLRNVAACESKRPTDHDAFVATEGHSVYAQKRWSMVFFQPPIENFNTLTERKIHTQTDDEENHISANVQWCVSQGIISASVYNYNLYNQANDSHATLQTRKGWHAEEELEP